MKPFQVVNAAQAKKMCTHFKPGDSTSCPLHLFKQYFPGLVYKHSISYIRNIRIESQQAQKKIQRWSQNLKYKEKIK